MKRPLPGTTGASGTSCGPGPAGQDRDNLTGRGQSRRQFLRNLGIAAAGTTLLAHGPAETSASPEPSASAEPQGKPGADLWQPAYQKLEAEGKLAERVEQAYASFEHCELCPRRCGVNRLAGEVGACNAPEKAVVFSAQPHFGEELPLVGRSGSGTIFFSNCNLRCVFCQNWPIAHEGRGRRIEDETLADVMLQLQSIGCHNINVVTPTHVMPNILAAVRIAAAKGLRIPLVYNTGGYDALEAIKLLDGIVDIYLPDLKFTNGVEAERYTGSTQDYPRVAKAAIAEMYRQAGNLQTDRQGIALRGVMIRHLVMPNRIAGTRDFVNWVADSLSPDTYVNIMSQYRVEHRAFEHPKIARAITPQEYLEAMEWAEAAGLRNLDERSVMQKEVFRRRS